MIELKTAHDAIPRLSPSPLARVRKCSFVLALLLGTPGMAQMIPTGRSTIPLEQVVAALKVAKLPLEDAEVRLLAQNTASTAEPRLEVRGVEPWGERGARVRIRCVAQEQCVPFYVGVSWADAAMAKAAVHLASGSQPGQQTGSSRGGLPTTRFVAVRPVVEADRAKQTGPSASGATGLSSNADPAAGSASVHAGSHATLLMDGQRLHIKLPVICLGNGAAGTTVRVTALDHRQSYLAEVIDSTLLKLTL